MDVEDNESSSSRKSAQSRRLLRWTCKEPLYTFGFSRRTEQGVRIAAGTINSKSKNTVHLLSHDTKSNELVCDASITHEFPPTRILWNTSTSLTSTDTFGTAADAFRLYEIIPSTKPQSTTIKSPSDSETTTQHNSTTIRLSAVLDSNKSSRYGAPLTSFDWNETNPLIIGTSSIDTTCTIWDVTTMNAKTQLIAHDREVYDIAFAPSASIFASVGADGSIRVFDLRALARSTIIYETEGLIPLLRLSWNKQDPQYIATFKYASNDAVIVDIRNPSQPASILSCHQSPVSSISWAPHSSDHIVTAGDDCQVLIWKVNKTPSPSPAFWYQAPKEINHFEWSSLSTDLMGITYEKTLELLLL